MNTVLWQTRSEILFDSVQQGRLKKQANGGNTYDYHAIQALRTAFTVQMDSATVRRSGDSKYEHAFRLLRNRGKADVVVKEASMIALSPVQITPVQIGLIHHIDDELLERSTRHKWFLSRLLKRLPRMDLIVTVSSYWKQKLESIGCANVEVIYNSFDLDDFDISDEEVHDFLKRENLPLNKDILYIGAAGARKGAVEVYEALKDQGYYMVVTGPNREIDIPVRWLNLARRDYLCLLKACSLVLTMSTMPEGWNRVAHEAMLCGTTVIGSGIGGMEELLTGGQQHIVHDFSQLRGVVEHTLKDKETYAYAGSAYVRQFDMDYFKREWIRLIHSRIPSVQNEASSLVQSQ